MTKSGKKPKKPLKNGRKKIVVAVSGGFDPVHAGHLQLLKEAEKLGDKLVVILNNDNWLKKKKGFVFMSQQERKKIIGALKWVDKVVITRHAPNPKDMSVNKELERIKPDIFANGGDRVKKNVPEVEICKEINCRMIFNVGRDGKMQSSSWLLAKFLKSANNNNEKK